MPLLQPFRLVVPLLPNVVNQVCALVLVRSLDNDFLPMPLRSPGQLASTSRAYFFGSEGWGFDSLRVARHRSSLSIGNFPAPLWPFSAIFAFQGFVFPESARHEHVTSPLPGSSRARPGPVRCDAEFRLDRC